MENYSDQTFQPAAAHTGSRRPHTKRQNIPFSPKRLFNYALWLLGRRNYHSSELKEKLKKKDATKEQIAEVLQKLSHFNYLNDAHYIENFLKNELLRKPQGLYLLKQKLLQKRILSEEIESALQNFPYNEEEQIQRALQKKKISLQCFSEDEVLPDSRRRTRSDSHYQTGSAQKEKAFRFLQARGFSIEGILKVLK